MSLDLWTIADTQPVSMRAVQTWFNMTLYRSNDIVNKSIFSVHRNLHFYFPIDKDKVKLKLLWFDYRKEERINR